MRTVAAAALACLFAAPAAAQETGRDIYVQEGIVTNVWADPARCNLGNARRMSLAEALRRVDSDYGHCVAIPVYVGGHMLFATRRQRALARSEDGNARGGHIGFYAKDSVARRARRHPRTRFWVVGNLSECRRAWPEAMVMGYCHYQAGPAPILIVAEIRAMTKP
jgi:hypothetical protein